MKITLDELEKRVNLEEHFLDISDSLITDSDISFICDYLKNNSVIIRLNISRNHFTIEGVKIFAANTTITKLNVSNNKLEDEGAKLLSLNTKIEVLNVSYCNIKSEGTIALSKNITIRDLSLRGNNIGFDGAKALATNSTITTLDVSWNKIRDNSAKALAANTTLKSLYVSYNDIGKEGVIALSKNTTLSTLGVAGSYFGEEVANALAKNSTLTSLSIEYPSEIGKNAKIAFIKALKNNTTILSVTTYFQESDITDALDKILIRNRVLPWLTTIKNARLMAQAQRSENCPLGIIPKELASVINNYAVAANHSSLFMPIFDVRPTEDDLEGAKYFAL